MSSNLPSHCDWTRMCSCIVCGVPRLGALPVQEGAPTRCCACASMAPKSHTSSSWQQRIWPGVKHLQLHVGDNDFAAEARWGSPRNCHRELQCAWQVGAMLAHLLRTLPPARSEAYARAHDDGMMSAMRSLFKGLPGSLRQQHVATQLATLPMWMGGLGLRSASRMAQAAYWASRADALAMLDQRLPENCKRPPVDWITTDLVSRPSWEELRAGARPAPRPESEPGEWPHGWQYFASSTVPICVHILVPGSAAVLCGCPTAAELKLQPALFRTVVLERLRLPLQVTEARCECGSGLDSRGRHRSTCPRSGRLKSRAVPTEKTLTRVCREAGATVRCNAKLRDMNINVSATD